MTAETFTPLDVPQLVRDAYERCREHLSPTPLEYSLFLSEQMNLKKP